MQRHRDEIMRDQPPHVVCEPERVRAEASNLAAFAPSWQASVRVIKSEIWRRGS